MSFNARDYLSHILMECDYLMSAATETNEADFLHNEHLKRSFTRSIEIIGEATKQLAPELLQQYPQIEWHAIRGMRNRLVHNYMGTNYALVYSSFAWHGTVLLMLDGLPPEPDADT